MGGGGKRQRIKKRKRAEAEAAAAASSIQVPIDTPADDVVPVTQTLASLVNALQAKSREEPLGAYGKIARTTTKLFNSIVNNDVKQFASANYKEDVEVDVGDPDILRRGDEVYLRCVKIVPDENKLGRGEEIGGEVIREYEGADGRKERIVSGDEVYHACPFTLKVLGKKSVEEQGYIVVAEYYVELRRLLRCTLYYERTDFQFVSARNGTLLAAPIHRNEDMKWAYKLFSWVSCCMIEYHVIALGMWYANPNGSNAELRVGLDPTKVDTWSSAAKRGRQTMLKRMKGKGGVAYNRVAKEQGMTKKGIDEMLERIKERAS